MLASYVQKEEEKKLETMGTHVAQFGTNYQNYHTHS